MSGKFVLKCIFISLCLATVFWASPMIYAANGDVDPTFYAGAFEPDASFTTVNAMAVQPDGKIIIAGSFTTINGSTHNQIARLNPNGSLDASFVPDVNNGINALALQPDGKIVIGGSFFLVNGTTHNSIARLNADGSVDTSFTTNVDGEVFAVILQPDGKILFGGNIGVVNNSFRYNVTRLNADGTLDTSFAPAFFDGIASFVYALSLQTDGKVLVGGVFSQIGGVSRINIARYNSNGSLDTAFNPIISTTNAAVRSIVLQADGKILVGGDIISINGTTVNRIARLNPDGSLDASLALSGFLDVTHIFAISLQADGKILIGGFFLYGQSPQVRHSIARLNSDGSRDTSFNTIFSSAPGGSREGVSVIAQTGSGIFIGGQFKGLNATPSPTRIARLITTPPTAANVSVGGCVRTAYGNGIRNVRVSLTAPNGETRFALTSAFGYYRFDDIPVGETYLISVSAKRFTFSQPTVIRAVFEEISHLDFVADPF